MIGQWIRILDPLLLDEVGWHRIKDAAEIQGDVDHRWRIELCCHVAILTAPASHPRGMPGAGAVICVICSEWKDGEVAA